MLLVDFNLFRPEVKHVAACLSETEVPLGKATSLPQLKYLRFSAQISAGTSDMQGLGESHARRGVSLHQLSTPKLVWKKCSLY